MTSGCRCLCALVCLAFVGCSGGEQDAVIAQFKGNEVPLAPMDSLALSDLGIHVPTDVEHLDSVLIIGSGQAKNVVDLLCGDKIIHCFNVGRGPGEILMASNFQIVGDRLYQYDIKNMRLWALDIGKTVMTGRQQADIVCEYNGMSEDINRLNRPFNVIMLPDGGIVASGIFVNDCWYGILGADGAISSPIPYVMIEGLEDFSNKQLAAVHTSNSLAVSPSGKKVASALLGIRAISMSEYSDGSLKENYRFVGTEPKVAAPGNKNMPALIWSPDSKMGFCDLDCDEECVYALYSGRRRGDEFPASECSWILVMDWVGNPVRAYSLSRTLCAFCLDGDRIFGVSSYPEAKLYVFEI